MLPRERVLAAFEFRPADVPALQILESPAGYFEHGEPLNAWMDAMPGDFAPRVHQPVPLLTENQMDEQGRYHEFRRDDWGTTWEYRIYGVWGHPCGWPLTDWAALGDYTFPPLEGVETIRARYDAQPGCFHLGGGGGLIEKMSSLRPFEDVLADIATDDPYLNTLADRLTNYWVEAIRRQAGAGADGVCIGDDYGVNDRLLISPRSWRAFFKPRLARLVGEAKNQGLKVLFHSCGYIWDILQDLAEIGVDAVWPQLPVYDLPRLRDYLRELHLAIALHPDRAGVMTRGTPAEVEALVDRLYDTFRPDAGGSWFYFEIDNGFPAANVRALISTIGRYRKNPAYFG